MNTCFFNQIIY